MREFPVLNLLHTKYGQQGLKVVAINLFSEDRFENVKSVVKQFEVQFQVLLDEEDVVNIKYQTKKTTPVNVLIDAKGLIISISRQVPEKKIAALF